MTDKYPENYLTIRWQRLPTALIAMEHANLSQLSIVSGTEVNANVESQRKLLEFELHLTNAHELYFKRQYQQAIDEYKLTQGLIYQMLNPSFPIAIAHRAEIKFLLDTRLFSPLLTASLEFVEALDPRKIESRFGPAFADVPENVIKELISYSDLGVNLADSIPRSVRCDSQIAAAYAERGQWKRAEYFYERAEKNLGRPLTPEAISAKAALDLSLGGIYIQTGRTADAQTLLRRAESVFKATEDIVGEAQVNLNKAAALAKEGKHDQARTYLTRAEPLIEKAQGLPRGDPIDLGSLLATRPGLTPAVKHLATAMPTRFGSVRPDTLSDLPEANGLAVTYRQPEKGGGWIKQRVETKVEANERDYMKELGILAGERVLKIKWKSGTVVPANQIINNIYRWRVNRKNPREVNWRYDLPSDFAAQLPHIYFYVIPVALGDCYHALGDFTRAEQYYLQAANYNYINQTLEVPALWARLATNYVDWGDRMYKQEYIEECQDIYARLITRDAIAPDDSPLYTLDVFAGPAADAQQLIAHLADPTRIAINPAIAWPILVAWARWQHLLAGLDFYGIEFTPIFTFEYLQQVARAFAQQAIQAEREYINFQTQTELEVATRREVDGAVAMANAEADGRYQQYLASVEESEVLDKACDLADLRYNQAVEEKNLYASAGYWQYITQSIATAHGAGESWYGDEIRRIAAKIEAWDWRGESKKKAGAAAVLLGGQKSYEYQLERLQNDIDELLAMRPIAQDQAQAAQHREEAARIACEAAKKRKELAEEAIAAFDNEVFTPEVWSRLAQAMQRLSAEYRDWAIRVAKRMERAYNFETDSRLRIVKNEYPTGDLSGLLAADYLLRDIESFTYHHTAHQRSKETQVKDVISLANEYPFLFYSFQQTGRMDFETILYDFDRRHPGMHGQRIKAVEVEIVGLLPQEGLRGTLRGGGLSRYRTADCRDKLRIHTVDTLALSEYTLRNDAFVYRADPRIHGLFEGHGVATSWELDLPRRSNNLDYRLIMDVRLVLYYTARYSETLKQMVLARAPLPGEMIHVRDLLLRYDFPEAWYGFLDSGEMIFTLDEDYMPRNETSFRTDKVALRLITAEGVSPADVAVTLVLPGQDPVTTTTDSNGEIAAEPGNALSEVVGGTLIGDWMLVLNPSAGSQLFDDDENLLGDLIEQIAIVVQYAFDWPT
jgi:hypothetical protein